MLHEARGKSWLSLTFARTDRNARLCLALLRGSAGASGGDQDGHKTVPNEGRWTQLLVTRAGARLCTHLCAPRLVADVTLRRLRAATGHAFVLLHTSTRQRVPGLYAGMVLTLTVDRATLVRKDAAGRSKKHLCFLIHSQVQVCSTAWALDDKWSERASGMHEKESRGPSSDFEIAAVGG